MPRAKAFGRARNEKVFGVRLFEINRRAFGWRKEIAQVATHKPGVVGLIHGKTVQLAIAIVRGKVKSRTADQRRKPGHRFAQIALLVEAGEEGGQDFLLKIETNFHRMTRAAEARPRARKSHGKFLERREASFKR